MHLHRHPLYMCTSLCFKIKIFAGSAFERFALCVNNYLFEQKFITAFALSSFVCRNVMFYYILILWLIKSSVTYKSYMQVCCHYFLLCSSIFHAEHWVDYAESVLIVIIHIVFVKSLFFLVSKEQTYFCIAHLNWKICVFRSSVDWCLLFLTKFLKGNCLGSSYQ